MTKVTIYRGRDAILGFAASGHSGFKEEGHDIVCAAISSAAMLTVNGICEIAGAVADVTVNEEDTLVSLMTDSKDAAVQTLLESFALHMQNLNEEYDDNIKLRILEV